MGRVECSIIIRELSANPDFSVSKPLLEWLLFAEEPSVRYFILTELLGKDENDPEVMTSRML